MGFTLIELLIVVAIISVLAAIAVPNFLEAQTRAKVTRVKADQRSMMTALETYAVDNSKYPVRRHGWDIAGPVSQYMPPFQEKIYDPDKPDAAVGLHVLTTPIAYMTSLPVDPFNLPAKRLTVPGTPFSDVMDYFDNLQVEPWLAFYIPTVRVRGLGKGYVLISVGPDGALNHRINGNPGGYPPDTPLTHTKMARLYDPTNGTISIGNIYRFQGNLEQRDLVP